MEEKEFLWITDRVGVFVALSMISIVISTIIFIVRTGTVMEHVIFALVSIFSYPIGYGGGLFVMGIQAQNSMCSVPMFDKMSTYSIQFFCFGWIYSLFSTPFLSMIVPDTTVAPPNINMALGGLGFILSTIAVRKKFFKTGRGSIPWVNI